MPEPERATGRYTGTRPAKSGRSRIPVSYDDARKRSLEELQALFDRPGSMGSDAGGSQVDPPSSCRTRGPEVWKLEDQVEGSLDVEDEVFSKAGCLTFVVVHCL